MFARLLVLFIFVPLVELVLLLRVGSKIGLIPTVAVIVITAILGAALTKRQGMQTLSRFQEALNQGRIPHEELIEGLMILVAGAVLLTPGFLTDAVGFLLLIPSFRRSMCNRLSQSFRSKFGTEQTINDPLRSGGKGAGENQASDAVEIEAEVIDPNSDTR